MVEAFSLILGSFIGLAAIKTLKIVNRVYPYILSKSFLSTPKNNTLKIALISGSTDGLGKSFASKMFSNNFSLILLGRSESKLSKCKSQLQLLRTDSKDQIIPHRVDFGELRINQLRKDIDIVRKLIQQKITVDQVNKYERIQVGFINSCGQVHISPYQQTSLDEIQRLNAVNINSFHFVLRVMQQLRQDIRLREIKVPKQYFLINISSGVDTQPNRYSSIYSGTKAYCSNIMRVLCLQNQMQRTESTQSYYLNLTPLYIRTKMVRFLKQWDVAEPDQIVEGAFQLLTIKQQGTGTLKHQLLSQFPVIIKQIFDKRVQQALQIRQKLRQIQNRRRQRKNNNH